jgi:hypothetical protein
MCFGSEYDQRHAGKTKLWTTRGSFYYRNSGGNYSNSPRGSSNSYNVQGNNLPRVNTQPSGQSSGSSSQPAYVAPRRNSNYEYRSAPVDGGQRTNSYSTPSYSSPSSSGGSGGGGGGGSSRGPR